MIYIEPLVRDYEQIINADPGWDAKLNQYQVQWVLVPGNERIVQALSQDTKWQIIYEDQTAIIFRKR
jgi:hypothetical protein